MTSCPSKFELVLLSNFIYNIIIRYRNSFIAKIEYKVKLKCNNAVRNFLAPMMPYTTVISFFVQWHKI